MLSRVAAVLTVLAAFAAWAGAAQAEPVRVQIVDHLDLGEAAEQGAVGLLVPGWGDTVSREGALAALRSGRVHHPLRPGASPPLVQVAEPVQGVRGWGGGSPTDGSPAVYGALLVLVELPPPGVQENDRRYPIVVVGGHLRGLLLSPSTRIDGLVSVADVAPTVLALTGQKIPESVTGHALSARADDDPVGALTALDRRLSETRSARLPAGLGYGLLTAALIVAAVLARSPLLGRTAVLALPAAAAASLALALGDVTSWPWFLVATAALAVGGAALTRSPAVLGLALVAVVGFYLAGLAWRPEAVSLSLLGPNPDAGGRFYGLSNELETVLLVPALLGAALLRGRLGPVAIAAVAGLAIVTLTAGRLGASVTGALVFAVGFAFLALDLERRRGALLVTAGAVAAALTLALAPPAHLAGAGPGRLADRIELSARLAVDGVQPSLLVFGLGLLPLLGLAARYRSLRARLQAAPAAALLAALAALAASALVNDSPGAVLAHGSLSCLALTAWGSVGFAGCRPGPSYTLASACAGLPSSRSRRWLSSLLPAAARRPAPPPRRR